MPINYKGAKLWFKTQEEMDEYDDKMISEIELKSSSEDDVNYSPIFQRDHKEFFLELNDKAKSDLSKLQALYGDKKKFIEKYYIGKRDHSIDRFKFAHRYGMGWAISYLLLRELPIRNFYARCWIMLIFFGRILENTGSIFSGARINAVADDWNFKEFKNFGIYKDLTEQIVPSNNNRVPEHNIWKLNQPGYMRETPKRYTVQVFDALFPPTPKQVSWDGCWNMPLEGLAHPLHKDAKHTDFLYE